MGSLMWDGDWDILVREKVRRRGGTKDPETTLGDIFEEVTMFVSHSSPIRESFLLKLVIKIFKVAYS
jgi:hypothetical protein